MPVRHAIWKVGPKPLALKEISLAKEQHLEDMIVADPAILSDDWMLIGRQEDTGQGGRVDLLAIAPDASIILIELKRNKTPRDVVAQAIDYASWLEQLTPERIADIYARFAPGQSLNGNFKQKFGETLNEDTLNESHQIIIVASSLDASTERIVQYLNSKNIAINVLFFQVFQHGNEEFLSRVWMIDPTETQVISTSGPSRVREPWNGEFYVSYGDDGTTRSWEEAREYGFICGGGGTWYSKTLQLLNPGDRVWVNIPHTGFVGIGKVTGIAQPANTFIVKTKAGEKPALTVLKQGHYHREKANNPDESEYFVPIKWIETVPKTAAFSELGLFGNQNTVCKPTTPKWRHTVQRLKLHFKNWNQ